MPVKEFVVPLPEDLYIRLEETARATKQTFTEVLVRAVRVGSPPNWNDAPGAFHSDLAALDRLDDDELWRIARSQSGHEHSARLQTLLEKNAEETLSPDERLELDAEINEADLFMLRKAHAASLLQWRGYTVPLAEQA